MNETQLPTDAEIIALNAGEIHFSESPTKYPEAGHGTQYHAGAPGVLSFARAVLAKWGAAAPVVAAGYALVPVEPTPEMLSEIWVHKNGSLSEAYSAMLAAAPQPNPSPAPVPPGQEGEREAIIRAAVAAMPYTNPLVADDLLEGHTMHTEADDIVAIWHAARAAPQPATADALDAMMLDALKHAQKVLNHHNLPLECGPINEAILAAQREVKP